MRRSRRWRAALHMLVLGLLGSGLIAATMLQTPPSSTPLESMVLPSFSFSGVVGLSPGEGTDSVFRPRASLRTAPSIFERRFAGQDSREGTPVRSSSLSSLSSFSAGITAAAASAPGGGVQPLADIVDPREPFVLYAIQSGDSASQIAERFDIELRTLLDNNPHLGDGDLISIGQELLVPRDDGILYRVGQGETVEAIVGLFDNVTSAAVVEYRPNAIDDAANLVSGNYVLLPGATVKPPAAPDPEPAPNQGGVGGTPTGGRFSLPLSRWNAVTDPFGVPRGGGTYHTGIDLGLRGANGAPVMSACEGTVSKVEHLTYSYGYHVIVDCGDGWATLYAHLSRIDATVGDRVVPGTQLGLSGSTGFSTGEHLHFEVRRNGAFANPADYLPF